ncbi:beta-lactamase family protein [Acidobacteria bacterium AH-259-D05]|nr:beta-lactamase family protein [Acidobacteria bacterium AH-259-D05]
MNPTASMTLWFLSVLLLTQSLVSGVTPQDELELQVDAAVLDIMDKGTIPGAAVGIMRDGEMLLEKGYGIANIEHAVPVKAETVFRIGSITKQFTAAGIIILADEGRLSLKDRLSEFFPDFPRGGEVTLHHLLAHTSGIHNITSRPTADLIKLMRQNLSMEDVMAVIKADGYDFDPGTNQSYSNSGYILLGAIIEKVSEQTQRQFFKQRIFDRLGMRHTDYEVAVEIVPNRASGYSAIMGEQSGLRNAGYISMTSPGGAGALISTVGDLAMWHHALFNGKVVGPQSFREMVSPAYSSHTELSDYDYGYGLQIRELEGNQKIGHGGNINGFDSVLYTYPQEKLTIVVLTNLDVGHPSPRIEEAVARILLGQHTSH